MLGQTVKCGWHPFVSIRVLSSKWSAHFEWKWLTVCVVHDAEDCLVLFFLKGFTLIFPVTLKNYIIFVLLYNHCTLHQHLHSYMHSHNCMYVHRQVKNSSTDLRWYKCCEAAAHCCLKAYRSLESFYEIMFMHTKELIDSDNKNNPNDNKIYDNYDNELINPQCYSENFITTR